MGVRVPLDAFCFLEVGFQDKEGHFVLMLLVKEGADMLVRMRNDRKGLLFVLCIIGNLLNQVRVVILNQNIVVIGDKTPLHKPRFIPVLCCKAKGVRREDPFKIGRYIVPFEGEDKFVMELLLCRHVPVPVLMFRGDPSLRIGHIA